MGLRLWPDVRKLVRAGVEGRMTPEELAERLVEGMPAAWKAMTEYGAVEMHLGFTLITPRLMELDVAFEDFPAALEQLHPPLRQDCWVAWEAVVAPALRDLAGGLRGAAEGDPVDRQRVDEALARIPIDGTSAAAIVTATPRLDAAWTTFTPPPKRKPEPPPPPGPDPIPRLAGMLKNAFELFSSVVSAGRAPARADRPLAMLPGPIARLHVERDAVIVVLDDGKAHRVRLADGAVTDAQAPADGRPDAVLASMPDAEGPIVDAATLQDGRIAAVGADKHGGFVVIGDPSTQTWDDRDEWESALLAVVPRGDRLLCGAADGQVVVFRTDELEAIGGDEVSRPDDRKATLKRRGETVEIPWSAIRAVAWLTDEQVVAGTHAGRLYVVELAWADDEHE